jgi:Polyketide cyclase / dehydrase and lipid transport
MQATHLRSRRGGLALRQFARLSVQGVEKLEIGLLWFHVFDDSSRVVIQAQSGDDALYRVRRKNVKPPLITTIALLFGNGSALGLEVDKKIEVAGAPAQIWEIARDFCAMKAWHPFVADCKQTNEGDTVLRTLTAKNGVTIKEKLVQSDDKSYSY